MKSIQNWGMILSLVAVICTVFEMLTPEGKVSKSVSSVISLFAVLTAALPLINLVKGLGDFNKYDFSLKIQKPKQESKLLSGVNDQISELASEGLRPTIESKLKELGVKPKKIEIFMDINENTGIVMIRCKIYTDQKPGVLAPEIEKEISKSLGLEARIIEV